MNTRLLKIMLSTVVVGGMLAVSSTTIAAEHSDHAHKKAAELKPYPLTTCLVSGEKLGEMGKPFVYKYKDREIKFCCKGCLKDFNKEPAKFIAKLEKAEKAAAKTTHGAAAHNHQHP